MSNIHLLEVVGRGSETQLQVGENVNGITGKGLLKNVIERKLCAHIG